MEPTSTDPRDELASVTVYTGSDNEGRARAARLDEDGADRPAVEVSTYSPAEGRRPAERPSRDARERRMRHYRSPVAERDRLSLDEVEASPYLQRLVRSQARYIRFDLSSGSTPTCCFQGSHYHGDLAPARDFAFRVLIAKGEVEPVPGTTQFRRTR